MRCLSLCAWTASLAMCAMCFVSSIAAADGEGDRAQARQLGQQGIEASERGDWAAAEDFFQRAERLYHAPTLLLGLARARTHLGKYVEAWEDYHRIVVEGLPANANAAARKALDEATKEMASVEGKQAQVTISVTGAAERPTVALDGTPLSAAALGAQRPIDPGKHTVHAEAPGFKAVDLAFTLAEGATANETIELQREPTPQAGATLPTQPATSPVAGTAPPPAPLPPGGGDQAAPAPHNGSMKTVAFVGIGVGGAGIVLGAITGALAISKRSSISGNPCASTAGCDQGSLTSYQSTLSSFHSLATVSTVSFIAGGALAATGVVLLVVSPGQHASEGGAWLTPSIGPGTVGAALSGAF